MDVKRYTSLILVTEIPVFFLAGSLYSNLGSGGSIFPFRDNKKLKSVNIQGTAFGRNDGLLSAQILFIPVQKSGSLFQNYNSVNNGGVTSPNLSYLSVSSGQTLFLSNLECCGWEMYDLTVKREVDSGNKTLTVSLIFEFEEESIDSIV